MFATRRGDDARLAAATPAVGDCDRRVRSSRVGDREACAGLVRRGEVRLLLLDRKLAELFIFLPTRGLEVFRAGISRWTSQADCPIGSIGVGMLMLIAGVVPMDNNRKRGSWTTH